MSSALPTVLLYSGVPPTGAFSIPWQNGSTVIIDQTTDTPYYWKPGTGVTPFAGGGGGGAVLSVFGRVGAIVAVSGDYTADLITGFVAGANITLTPGVGTLTIAATIPPSTPSINAITVTLPYEVTVGTAIIADAACTALSQIIISQGAVLATDTNDPEMDDISFFAVPDVGQFTVTLTAQTQIGGPFKLNYLLG